MQTGTAVGLLVGGAVLLLAVSPPRQTVAAASGAQVPAPAIGGALNPFNWFSGGAPSLGSQIFGGQQPAQLPPGYQPAGQQPRFTDIGYGTPAGGYATTAYAGDQGAGAGGYSTPSYFPVMTPGGGMQYVDAADYGAAGANYAAGYDGAGYQDAGYYPTTAYATDQGGGMWV